MRERPARSTATPLHTSRPRAARSPQVGGGDWLDAAVARRRRWAGPGLAAAVALLLLGGGRLALVPVEAALPDFSGTWTYDPPVVEAGPDDARAALLQTRPPSGLCAERCAIVQRDGTLLVTRLARGAGSTTYRLDGVERRSLERHVTRTVSFEVATRVVWDGATLAIHSTAGPPQAAQVRTTLSLVDDTLVIDTWIDRNGRHTTQRLTYRRAED